MWWQNATLQNKPFRLMLWRIQFFGWLCPYTYIYFKPAYWLFCRKPMEISSWTQLTWLATTTQGPSYVLSNWGYNYTFQHPVLSLASASLATHNIRWCDSYGIGFQTLLSCTTMGFITYSCILFWSCIAQAVSGCSEPCKLCPWPAAKTQGFLLIVQPLEYMVEKSALALRLNLHAK